MLVQQTAENKFLCNNLQKSVGLSAYWQNRAAAIGGTQTALIPKEHGQLKRLKDSLGMERATQVIDYVFQNWLDFGYRVKASTGVTAFPSKPHIGFLLKYHATALTLLQGELQSIAKKKAAEEQAKKEAQAIADKKAMQELKSKEPSITLMCLTQEQLHAYLHVFDHPANEAWVDKVSEKHGEWRPAVGNETGIPCEIEFKKAG